LQRPPSSSRHRRRTSEQASINSCPFTVPLFCASPQPISLLPLAASGRNKHDRSRRRLEAPPSTRSHRRRPPRKLKIKHTCSLNLAAPRPPLLRCQRPRKRHRRHPLDTAPPFPPSPVTEPHGELAPPLPVLGSYSNGCD
jgi:hypothetical protein